MADNKLTYSEALAKVIAVEGLDAEVVEKLKTLKASIEKKATNRKPSKTQKENEGYKTIVLESLAQGKATASELAKRNEATADFSTPKIVGILKMLIEEGKVERIAEGRKAIFSLKAEVEEDIGEPVTE